MGRAIAAALLREGARVMISARDPKRLEAARALAPENILVNAVVPYIINTDMVTFLASGRSSFVTGAAWHVDGGACRGI